MAVFNGIVRTISFEEIAAIVTVQIGIHGNVVRIVGVDRRLKIDEKIIVAELATTTVVVDGETHVIAGLCLMVAVLVHCVEISIVGESRIKTNFR